MNIERQWLALCLVGTIIFGTLVFSQIAKKEDSSVEINSPPSDSQVIPSDSPEVSPPQESPSSKYTEEELEILAIIVYQEAGGDMCSDDTRQKVAEVFMNRVDSPLFPDTIYEVAVQKSQYGTLSKTGIKWPDRASKPEEAHAVDRAYTIAKMVLESDTRSIPSNVVFQAEFEQGDGTYCFQDNLYFCYVD